jgi:hypothetical protein
MMVGSTIPPTDRLRASAIRDLVQSLRFTRPPHPPRDRRRRAVGADERLVRADELLLLGGDGE